MVNVYLPFVAKEEIMLNRENYKYLIDNPFDIEDLKKGLNITFTPSNQTGLYWEVAAVYHLKPDENAGKHVIFVDVVDNDNNWVDTNGLSIKWGWDGQQSNETSPNKQFEKNPPEFRGQVDLNKGAKTWLKIQDESGVTSDVVNGLHSDWENLPFGNTFGHNSFIVIFKKGDSLTIPVEPEEETDLTEIKEQWDKVSKGFTDLSVAFGKLSYGVAKLNDLLTNK